ncbi:hypothetical protein I7I51_08124 [Histoplasma capsulatum]|uniref:Uncharacterized protein n=1 Tax=Ajellomyces capsulatus TaxID=5037 RepID=A0A8A1LZK0_AJECA|nr:hypothetical protein I7I51_08124 [Histoplasma capsulatum]
MAKIHRRLFANTPPHITAETVCGVTMEGLAVDRGPATKGSHSWTEPQSPSAEEGPPTEFIETPYPVPQSCQRLKSPGIHRSNGIGGRPIPSHTPVQFCVVLSSEVFGSNTDELVVTEQQNEGNKQDTSSLASSVLAYLA